MKFSSQAFRTFWKNLGVTQKLVGIIGLMATFIATELFTLLFAMDTLSAVRAFVEGEALWSKAQKNAILELERYAITRDEKHYLAFKKDLEVPLGDHRARLEMQKPQMNMSLVREGFVAGQVHPDDIPPMVRLMRRFYKVSYLANAIEVWRQGDESMAEFIAAGEELHLHIQKIPRSVKDEQLKQLLAKISKLNLQLTELEKKFSETLGEASRWLEHILMIVLIIAVATIETTGLMLMITFSRGLARHLNELEKFATQVGSGDFMKTVPIRSGDEIGRLAKALNKMAANLRETVGERESAEAANQSKSLFLANMSHEIRTPLSAILGFIELLKEPAITPSERRQYLEIVERTGRSLATIINDILDLSKVEADKFEIEKVPTSLHMIFNDLKSLLKFKCEEKGILLNFNMQEPLPPIILTDPIRYKQIILNIIGNAIKFTNKGSVNVSVQAFNDHLVCTVQDTGIGISQEHFSQLFQPFSQVDSSIRKRVSGTGLGLALSKRLAQRMGGDIYLKESKVGIGTTFVVETELLIAENNLIKFPENRLRSKTKDGDLVLIGKKVLIVDDSIDNQLLAKQYLLREGVDVDVANHGGEALEKIGNSTYDAILMDIQMPVMDGLTATAELRSRGITIPVIGLTAHAMKEDLDRCLKAGCDSYLTKPFQRDQLMALLKQYIGVQAAKVAA